FLDGFQYTADLPYLPDMARLEWLLHRAHYAPSADTVDAQALAAIPAEEIESATMDLAPTAQLFASEWDVVQLWLAHQDERSEEFPQQMRHTSYALVIRPKWKTAVVPQSAAAHSALSVLQQGATFGEALDEAFERDDAFDVAAHLKQWLEQGVFSAVKRPGEGEAK
ncbi:MAG TPA: DUF2063 domain-containing protein, partial [Pseudoduganella sp.]